MLLHAQVEGMYSQLFHHKQAGHSDYKTEGSEVRGNAEEGWGKKQLVLEKAHTINC